MMMMTRLRFPRAFTHSPMIVSDSPPELPGAPGRIHVGGVDGVEARGGEDAVEHVERRFFVGGPAEHVAAEHERGDGQIGAA